MYYKISEGKWNNEEVFGLFCSEKSEFACDSSTIRKGVDMEHWNKRSKSEKDEYIRNLHSEMRASGNVEAK